MLRPTRKFQRPPTVHEIKTGASRFFYARLPPIFRQLSARMARSARMDVCTIPPHGHFARLVGFFFCRICGLHCGRRRADSVAVPVCHFSGGSASQPAGREQRHIGLGHGICHLAIRQPGAVALACLGVRVRQRQSHNQAD